METVVRVSRHRKCSGSIDLIKPKGGISCYMLSFGDLDNPELDCEVYLTVFELHKLQEYLNEKEISVIPDCEIKPQKLNIMVKVAANNLETCSLCGKKLSEEMYCYIHSDNNEFWVMEFVDFHLGFGSPKKEYYATQIQIECASFQLAEVRGAVNGLLRQVHERREDRERVAIIDREARDKAVKGEMEKDKQIRKSKDIELGELLTANQPDKSRVVHRGFC